MHLLKNVKFPYQCHCKIYWRTTVSYIASEHGKEDGGGVTGENIIAQFQVGYMSFDALKQLKTFIV